jgi:hypothetical protein
MKKVEYWKWRMKAETHGGKVYNTRHEMTEAEALRKDPNAVRVPGSMRIIEVAETPDEIAARAPTTRSFMEHAFRARSLPQAGMSYTLHFEACGFPDRLKPMAEARFREVLEQLLGGPRGVERHYQEVRRILGPDDTQPPPEDASLDDLATVETWQSAMAEAYEALDSIWDAADPQCGGEPTEAAKMVISLAPTAPSSTP